MPEAEFNEQPGLSFESEAAVRTVMCLRKLNIFADNNLLHGGHLPPGALDAIKTATESVERKVSDHGPIYIRRLNCLINDCRQTCIFTEIPVQDDRHVIADPWYSEMTNCIDLKRPAPVERLVQSIKPNEAYL